VSPLSVLTQRPIASIEQVVDVMTAIEDSLPASDGVRAFNHLYLSVTRAVLTAMKGSRPFGDPAFLNRLDIVFAELYFDALAAGDRSPSAAPPAWRPLLRARSTPRLHPLQHALAGMNAHINRDLPAGIVAVYEEMGGDPTQADRRHDDFLRVNDILEAVESQIKSEYTTGIVGAIDAIGGPLDDQIAMWKVRVAREAAWTNAQVLWTLRSKPALRQDYFDRLDRFTGFAARGLLVPVAAARI
jgi:hypothetical protein